MPVDSSYNTFVDLMREVWDYLFTRNPLEDWRPVVGFEHAYEVSNRGRVRRKLHRRVPIAAPTDDGPHDADTFGSEMLTPHHDHGYYYPVVELIDARGFAYVCSLHRVVMRAWGGVYDVTGREEFACPENGVRFSVTVRRRDQAKPRQKGVKHFSVGGQTEIY